MKRKLLLLITLTSFSVFSQVKTDEVSKLEEKIATIQAEFNKDQSIILARIDSQNEDLKSYSSNQIKKRVEALEGKQADIELLAKREKEKDIHIYQAKYEAGILVLKDVLQSLGKLKSQYAAVQFNDSYKELSNPNSYTQYKENLDFLKKKLVKNGLTLPNLNLNNSLLNAIYGITQSIVSDQPDKNLKIEELKCILNFTSMASQELNIVKYDLEYLNYCNEKMLTDYKEAFKSYSAFVGYTYTFDDYIKNADEDLTAKTSNYFNTITTKEVAAKDKDINDIKFQLQKVMNIYMKYEMFIAQNSAYYDKFDLIITNIKPVNGCESVQSSPEIKEYYDAVKTKLQLAKSSFTDAFVGTIKQSYLKTIIQ